MSRVPKFAILLLALVLVLSLFGLGCGGDEESEDQPVTIKIGYIADLTGPASSFLRLGNYPLYDDYVKKVNEEKLLGPNVTLEIIYYDGKYDPSLDVQAYDYLRQQGCQFLMSTIPTSGDSLKTFVDRDKVFFLSLTNSDIMTEPPGWVFCMPSTNGPMMKAFLKWVAENDWDYAAKGRKPKIGTIGWEEQYTIEANAAIKEYCQAHPDQFELGPQRTTPFGTVSWTSEVEAMKDCDYVYPGSIGVGVSTFIKQYRAAGYTGKFFGNDALTAYKSLILGEVDWSQVDGTLVSHSTIYWSEKDNQLVKDCLALLQKYSPNEVQAIVDIGGVGSISNYPTLVMLIDFLNKAIDNAGGASKLTQQDLYDTAIDWSWNQEGVERNWGTEDRAAREHIRIYRWDASAQDLVKASDWLPNVNE